ncbi:flagellar hook-associated protein FlgK [Alicyclobacillus fructus]|uniref:flagellar hook-associated protein FlgK n=1 Tax=Alicyclobacillus fructus TaxID=2816082 RepID=UPI001A8C6485|nr:flagellar hook-associated protein FlgK [Alicyclobacillus fructus]
MPSTFLGLQTALRGLEVSQAGVATVSHNVDNADTPGYAREVVDISEMPSIPQYLGGNLSALGQGAQVTQIQRIQSDFLSNQYRVQNAVLNQANVVQSTLNEVSGILDEPSSTGISNALTQFYQAWDTLGSNPSDLSARTSVIDAAQTLTQVMNQTANQLNQLRSNLQSSLASAVNQVNSLLDQIASVSNEIAKMQQLGEQPNSLLDQRDALLNQLSQYTSFQTQIQTVTQGGVSYDQFSLTLTGSAGPVTMIDGMKTDFSNGDPPANLVHHLVIASDTGDVSIVPITSDSASSSDSVLAGQGGQIQGYQDSIADVQTYQSDLDVFAQSLAGPGTTVLTSGWTIPASLVNSPPYNKMEFTPSGGTKPLSLQDFITNEGLVETNGSYTIPAGTKIATSLGGMTVTLLGPLTVSSATLSNFGNMTIQVPGGEPTTFSDYVNSPVSLPAGTVLQNVGLNQLLTLGYSENGQGKPLFTSSATAGGQPITAANITVAIQPSDLAAGTTSQTDSSGNTVAVSGDGTLATLIGNMANQQMQFPNPSSGSSATGSETLTGSLSSYLTAVVGQLGLQSQQASNTVNVQTSLLQQISNQQQSVSGVSMDEEMTNLISYQQAYNASAEIISAINAMLTQLMQNV